MENQDVQLCLEVKKTVVTPKLKSLVVIVLIMTDWVSTATAMVLGVVAMLFAGLLSPGKLYDSIDWPVIILLAAMLPVGCGGSGRGGTTFADFTGSAGFFVTLLGCAASPGLLGWSEYSSS